MEEVTDPIGKEEECEGGAQYARAAAAQHAVVRRAHVFKALSNPTRLRILGLVARGQQAMCESELVAPCCRGQPTISYHVKVLKDAGLLECERRGPWCHYFVRKDALRKLAAVLDEIAR